MPTGSAGVSFHISCTMRLTCVLSVLQADGMPEYAQQVGNLILAHPYFSIGYGDVPVVILVII